MLLDTDKKYRKSERGKQIRSEQHKRHYQKHKERLILRGKLYRKTIEGKQTQIKHSNKRRRELGFIPMFSNPFEEKIEWHHITDVYVVAIPKDLHHLYMGKNHRENTMEIAKQIYLRMD